MKLVFGKGSAGRKLDLISPCDVPQVSFEKAHIREEQPRLSYLSESETSRYYTELAKRSYGADDGLHPSDSCIMKYSPKVNEEVAALKGFRGVHPLQPEAAVQGPMEVLYPVEKYLCEVTSVDAMTSQPATGAHGEFTGLLLIKTYHVHHSGVKRTEIAVPDPTHGTNPVSAAMCGYDVVSISFREDDCVDLEQLKAAVGDDMAGLILTDPNTMGLFDKNILEITKIVHDISGLYYYDGVNLNAVMGIIRPGDTEFDVAYLNLHRIFSTPHSGGGPGDGPVGYKEFSKPFMPDVRVEKKEDTYHSVKTQESIGDVKMFYDSLLVVVRALTYILILEKEGIPEAACNAVLNANYMKVKLSGVYGMAYNGTCMREPVTNLEKMKCDKNTNVMGIVKALLDYDIHPSTIYFPLIAHEALMVEPTETESKETLDEAIGVFYRICEQALADPKAFHSVPHLTPIGRPGKVTTTHKPILRYIWE